MNRKVQGVPDPKHRTKRARPEPQMSLLSQKLQAMALHLNWKFFRICIAKNFDFRHLQFGQLPPSLARFNHAFCLDSGTCIQSFLDVIRCSIPIDHQLQIANA